MASVSDFNVERLTVASNLTDRVSGALIELIRGEDFPPGTRLPSEMSMGKRFGVSRTVIREAISRLKSEGLVESRQGSGVFVREGNVDSPFRIAPASADSIQSVLHVVELRLSLEGEIAAFAAKRRTSAQLKAIRQALKQIETDESEGKDGVDADIAFHRSIADATGNPQFPALIEFLFHFLRKATATTRSYEATKKSLSREVKEEHLAIVEAISRQDPEAARAAARRHMEGATRRLRNVTAKQG